MFTKEQINKWAELYATSDNYADSNERTSPPPGGGFLKRDLLEAKVQVDRWGVVVTDWIFHTSKKDLINKIFAGEVRTGHELKQALKILAKYAEALEKGTAMTDMPEESKDIRSIWGATIHYTDDISEHALMGLALRPDNNGLMKNDSDNISNSIIMFPMCGYYDG